MLCILTIFITFIVTASAIAFCPFTCTVRLSGAKVLEEPKQIERSPKNSYIHATYSNGPFHKNYFEISEDEASCKNDEDQQDTVFQVIVGSEASPLSPDHSLDLRNERRGRNCILKVRVGPNKNLELDGGVSGGLYCTKNITLDLSGDGDPRKYIEDPLRRDWKTGKGHHPVWAPFHDGWPTSVRRAFVGWGDTKDEIDSHFIYYPEFITP